MLGKHAQGNCRGYLSFPYPFLLIKVISTQIGFNDYTADGNIIEVNVNKAHLSFLAWTITN